LERRRAHSPRSRGATDLPEDGITLVDAHLLDLGSTYGAPESGDPIEYDALRIEHDEGRWRSSFDRATLLFRTDSEAVRWIHQVCCWLGDIAP
jgi:hypothetical protein